MHVGVGDQPALPPEVVDPCGILCLLQTRCDQAIGQAGPVVGVHAEQRRVDRLQANKEAAAEGTVAVEAPTSGKSNGFAESKRP